MTDAERDALVPDDPAFDDLTLGSRPISFLVLLSAVIALMLLVGSIFVDRVGVAAIQGGPTLVDVPSLVGADLATAKRLLNDADLQYEVTEKQNVSVPPGQVIEQRPLAGERVVADSTTVEVVVSAGDDFTLVPDVRGSPRQELELLLMVHGLYLGDIGYEENDLARDEVIGQFPAPGERIPRGTPVHVMLSSGPPMIDIPDVRNLTESEAVTLLRQAGFFVLVEERQSFSVPRGSAMSTDPGNEAPRGSQILLYVSAGPPRTTTTAPPPPAVEAPAPETYAPTPSPAPAPSESNRGGQGNGRGGGDRDASLDATG